MDFLTHLWLPIVLSAVAVWFASALAWMAIHHHDKDRLPLPNEKEFMDFVESRKIPPGNYGFPDFQQCKGMTKDQKKAAYDDMQKHPMGMLNVWGPISMGGNMIWTFVVMLIVSTLIAYLAWAARPHSMKVTVGGVSLGEGLTFGRIFQVVGTAGILAYCFASFPNDIWFQKSRRAMAMNFIDGVAFGLITGAVFAWLWPK